MKNFISVDPGIGGTGYAIWNKKVLVDFGTIYPDGDLMDWHDRVKSLSAKFMGLIYSEDLKIAVLEFPMFMQGSGGLMVASAGDLVKLSVLTGVLAGYCYPNLITEFVTPRDWKGQLPKSVSEKRIRSLITLPDKRKISNHAIDAIGIGLWKLGLF